MDSAALGILALTSQRLSMEERWISLVGPQGTAKQVLEMANIDKLIAVFPTEDAAAAARAA
ncbi:MAG: STAS domain-containing protein [Nitrospira sp.]